MTPESAHRTRSRRFGGRRAFLRVLITWIVNSLALLLIAEILPGLHFDEVWAAPVFAAVLALVNALLWPTLVYYALPVTALTLGAGALVLNGVLVSTTAGYIDGVQLSTWVDGIVVAFGITLVNTLATELLAIDDEDFYYRNVIRRAARRDRTEVDFAVPGVLFIQVDGLAAPVLRRAVRNGDAPTLARWLHDGTHRLLTWETTWTSQTGASQAGILFGNNHDMPAFRWIEKDSGRTFVSNHPSSAAELEARQSDGRGLLHADGVGRGNVFTGDAVHASLTMSGAGRRSGRIGEGYYPYFANPYSIVRTVIGFSAEVIRELWQATLQRRLGVRPRVSRGGLYPFLRAFTTVLSRDVTTQTLIGDLYAGRSVIYADYLGYDEVAHHSGPERHDALDTLRRIDKDIARLARAAADAPREYRIVVLSDHGQSQGETFEDRFGQSLGDVVRGALAGAPVVADCSGTTQRATESWGYADAALTEAGKGEGPVARMLRRGSRRRESDPEEPSLFGPHSQDAVVMASGNMGLVYVGGDRERLTLEQITARHADLLPRLVDHPGIGFVVVLSQTAGPIVLGRNGSHALDSAVVRGEDPLLPFGPDAPWQVADVAGFPHAADVMVNSMLDVQTDEVAAFEHLVGSHGGLGGDQTHAFVLHPVDLEQPGEPVRGAVQVHLLFRRWLGALGHPAFASDDQPVRPEEDSSLTGGEPTR